jgi:hypothetical protein
MKSLIFVIIWQFFCISLAQAKNLYSWEWMTDKNFLSSYQHAINDREVESWIKQLSGPSSKSKVIMLDGKEGYYISVCKPHDCAFQNISLIYFPNENKVYGLIISTLVYFIGEPSDLFKERLIDMHKKTYKHASLPKGNNNH